MTRVAYLTSSNMLAGSPDERADSFEHRYEMERLVPACREVGIELVETVWNDPALQPDAFDAWVVGTTWDYQEHFAEFLARLEAFERARPLFNPLATMRWNLNKGYLRDLAERGVAIVPTQWLERADDASIAAAFDALGADELVVKPEVGASAWRQVRVRRGEPLPPAEERPPGRALAQPFLASATTEGEYSHLYFDRVFSHCAQKLPAAGDYRVQSIFGGRERVHEPTADEHAIAQAVVDAVDGPLLYARVDLMRLDDGRLALMELELIEPYLYPEQGPHMGEPFAAALTRMLAGQPQG